MDADHSGVVTEAEARQATLARERCSLSLSLFLVVGGVFARTFGQFGGGRFGECIYILYIDTHNCRRTVSLFSPFVAILLFVRGKSQTWT